MSRGGASKLKFGWQTIKPWQDGYNAFHVEIYSWLPFDAHVDVLWTRWCINLVTYYPQIKVGFTIYDTHAHFDLDAWFGFGFAVFWPRFWERRATKEKRAAELEALRARIDAAHAPAPSGVGHPAEDAHGG